MEYFYVSLFAVHHLQRRDAASENLETISLLLTQSTDLVIDRVTDMPVCLLIKVGK